MDHTHALAALGPTNGTLSSQTGSTGICSQNQAEGSAAAGHTRDETKGARLEPVKDPPRPAEASVVLDNLGATLACLAQHARQKSYTNEGRQSDLTRLEQAARNLHTVLQEERSIKFLEELRSSGESGTWANALAGGPSEGHVIVKSQREEQDEPTLSAMLSKLVGIVIFFPAGISLICFLACALVAAFEDWALAVSFNYVVSTTCGTAPVGDASQVSPQTTQGALLLGLVATWTLGVTGLFVGYVSNEGAVLKYLDSVSSLAGSSELGKLGAILLQILVLGPLLVITFSIILGGFLAAAEGWSFPDGVLYMLGDTTGQPNPLVSNTPVTSAGMFLTVASAMWGFVATSIVIGLASSMESPDWGALRRSAFRARTYVAETPEGTEGQQRIP